MAILLYGANGYSGELIARLARQQQWPAARLMLAGRNAAAIAALGAELGFAHRVFDLDDATAIDGALGGIRVVLNCAGPFSRTAQPLADACLRARVHYLDITAEIAVLEAMRAQDAAARAAGVMLLPSVGFDVVPSDCLAAHVASRLPAATHLRMAFQAGKASRGTSLTALENVGMGGLVRRDGKLVRVPAGHETLKVDLGDGPTTAVAIPWGDVVTAYATTGIPNIQVFIVAPWPTRTALYATRYLKPVLTSPAVQRFAGARIRARITGPSEEQRQKGHSLFWAEARDAAGRVVVSRQRTPEAYQLTALTALELARRTLDGHVRPGYQTPAGAFGKDVILEFPGVTRQDE